MHMLTVNTAPSPFAAVSIGILVFCKHTLSSYPCQISELIHVLPSQTLQGLPGGVDSFDRELPSARTHA